MSDDRFVVVGKVGAPFGVAGWQHIQSYTDPIENIVQYLKLYIGHDQNWKPYEVAESRRHHQGLVARLRGIEDRDKAALLTNALIAVERKALSPLQEGEYYWTDLEGFTVLNHQERVGILDYFYQNANVDVMVVRNENKEQHIPFIMGETVVSVEMEKREIMINWDFIA